MRLGLRDAHHGKGLNEPAWTSNLTHESLIKSNQEMKLHELQCNALACVRSTTLVYYKRSIRLAYHKTLMSMNLLNLTETFLGSLVQPIIKHKYPDGL